MKRELTKYTAEISELHELVLKTRRELGPRLFVENRKTGVFHRVATKIEEAGMDSKTLCGWKYARGSMRLHTEAPTVRKLTCDTCLPALRAALPKLG